MLSRTRLLRSARLQLKNKVSASELANGFDAKDFSKAAKGRGSYPRKERGSRVSRKILDAVDATARDLPHTKEGAKKGRSSMEALQHHFGMGSVFLTVTFDDDNNFNIQVLSGIVVDNDDEIQDLSDEELGRRAKHQQNIRMEFPGIASLNFEMMLDILLEEVIGWDIKAGESTKVGLFGKVMAMAYAVEEQGRKTLHAHFILWIENYRSLQNDVFFGDYIVKREATRTLNKYFEHLCSTAMFPPREKLLQKAFDHSCSVADKHNRLLPEVASDQHLRDLRHKCGYEFHDGAFATCPHCKRTWTYEELVTLLMEEGYGIKDKVTPQGNLPTANEVPKVAKARLFAKCVEYQKGFDNSDDVPRECINAAYQTHASNHHKNCFRCNKMSGQQKKKHVCGSQCECRYRLPDRARKSCVVNSVRDSSVWFQWTGEKKEQPLVHILPKRNRFDLFQNVSCAAISESKFTCNSNVALITDGPIGMYTVKYVVKDTTGDDVCDYKEVDASMKKMDGPKHQHEKAEAMRIICRAAFAHNKSNVISAAMASYLIRHDSRFYFSHRFAYCPLNDIIRLHNKQDVSGSVNFTPDGKSYFENAALHYLCRPDEVEDVSVKVFCEKYEVAYAPKKENKDNPVMPFKAETGFFLPPKRSSV